MTKKPTLQSLSKRIDKLEQSIQGLVQNLIKDGGYIQDLQDQMNEMEQKFKINCSQVVNNDETGLKNDISNADYVTITADDVVVGGESVREYNGEKIFNYYHLPAYFKEIRDTMQEKGIKLLEIHCLQSSTNGEYAKTGNPVADKDGCNAWCCVVWEDNHGNKTTGPWVFSYTFSSAADCAYSCALDCARSVRGLSAFRAAVFGDAD